MKEWIKRILQSIGIYHPLQRAYRQFLFRVQHQYIKWIFRRYRGGDLHCNFCRVSYSRFAPRYPSAEDSEALEKYSVIAGYGENTWCPECMSTARERLVLAMLQDKFDPQGKRILHISPEKNIYEYLIKRSEVTAVDLEPEYYKGVAKNVEFGNATDLKYPNDKFDMVIANHVLEHIPDDRKALKEILRVLRPGGIAILQVPYSSSLERTIEDPGIKDPARQSKLFGQRDHVRIYSLDDYMSRLREAGFKVEFLNPLELASQSAVAFQPGEGFFICLK